MKHVAEPPAERIDKRRAVHRLLPAEPAAPASTQREVSETVARPAPPMSARTAVMLQRQAGNRATVRLLAQRQKTTAAPPSGDHGAAAVERSAVSGPATVGVGGIPVQRLVAGHDDPSQDPKFAALKSDVRAKQKRLIAHPPAHAEAKAAQDAAKPPQDDKEAQGKAANAEKLVTELARG